MKFVLKQGLLSALILLAMLSTASTLVVAANYGSDIYGGGVYNTGVTPTATPTPTPTPTSTPTPTQASDTSSTSGSSSDSGPRSAPGCGDESPGSKSPWLYAAHAQSSDSIRLFFTPGDPPIDKYVLEYGNRSGFYQWSATDIGNTDTTSYLVQSLSPSTTYYFRVRGSHGCAVGSWSNEISSTTQKIFSTKLVLVDEVRVSTEATTSSADNSKTAEKINATPDQNDKMYSFTVRLSDQKQRPIVGAKVSIHSNIKTAITDSNGVAIFEKVEPGEHKLTISYHKYEGEQTIFLSGEENTIKLDITIEQKNVLASPLVIIIISIMGAVIIVLSILLSRKKTSH